MVLKQIRVTRKVAIWWPLHVACIRQVGVACEQSGVIAVVVETTDRVMAQRETAAQGERLAQMFQDAPSFMAQLEGPGHVFTVTNAAYQQLIAHRDVIGRPIRKALPSSPARASMTCSTASTAAASAMGGISARFPWTPKGARCGTGARQ